MENSIKCSKKSEEMLKVINEFSNAPVGIKIQHVQRSKSSNQRRARTPLQSNEILAFVNKMNHRRARSRYINHRLRNNNHSSGANHSSALLTQDTSYAITSATP